MGLNRHLRHLGGSALALTLALQSVAGAAQAQVGAPTWRHFPAAPTAPKGAPNVLLIMTDDVGFGSASTFGGLIPTPTFDELAAKGLRYNEFHTTAMCSPTRAALLTGRNAHAVASGSITNVAVDEAVLASLEARIDDLISGDFPAEERDLFCKGELPSYLETVLSSKYDTEELRDRINGFNQKVLELVVHYIKQVDAPLPPEVRQHLSRLFLDDTHCNYYFEYHGAIRPEHPLAHLANGPAARLPAGGASRYYVGNINHFFKLGGYDAIVTRMNAVNAAARAALVRTDSAASGGAAAGGAGGGGGGGAASAGEEKDDNPLEEARVFSSIIYIPRLCYTEEWARRYNQPTRDAIMERVLTLSSAQLKKASRELIEGMRANFLRLGQELTRMYPAAADDIFAGPAGTCAGDNAYSATERWQLALAARLLRCDALTLRVKGMSDIKEMTETLDDTVTVARQRVATRAYGVVMYQTLPPPVAHWFTADKLLPWLREHHVLDVVLGDSPDGAFVPAVHSQTVSRLAAIINFVARHDAAARARGAPDGDRGFTPHHMDLLLRLAQDDTDDALQRAVFDIIIAAAKWLPMAELRTAQATVATLRPSAQVLALWKALSDDALTRVAEEDTAAAAAAAAAAAGADDAAPPAAPDAEPAADGAAAAAGGDEAGGAAGGGGAAAGAAGAAAVAAVPATKPAPEFTRVVTWEDDTCWWSLKALAGIAMEAEAGCDAGLVTAAAAAVVELVRPPTRYRQAGILLDRALGNVRDGRAVYASLKLADALLRQVPLTHAGLPRTAWREGVIARLDASLGLKALLLGEAHRYKTAAAAAAAAAVGTAGAALVVERVAHVDNVNTRLGFLLYVLQSGELELTAADVDALWSLFVDRAVTGEEAEAFFTWLHGARFAPARTAVDATTTLRLFPADLCAHIFNALFCAPARFKPAAAGPAAFKAFEMFLRATNGAANKLVKWEADDYTVAVAELAGLDTLWVLAMEGGHKEVQRDAVALLIHLHARLSLVPPAGTAASDTRRIVNERKQAVWVSFVEHCMGAITRELGGLRAAGVSPAAERAHTRRVGKTLRLLATFLEAVEASGTGGRGAAERDFIKEGEKVIILQDGPPHPGSPAGREGSIEIYFHYQGQTQQHNMGVRVRPMLETVGAMRSRMGDAFELTPDRIRLTLINKKAPLPVASDHLTLAEARVEAGFMVEPLGEPTADTRGAVTLARAARVDAQLRRCLAEDGLTAEQVEEELARRAAVAAAEGDSVRVPRRLLSTNAAYFDLLFALLSLHAPAVVSDAWALLQTLPVNAKLEADIHTLRGRVADADAPAPAWEEVLDARAPLKLLYALQILDKHMDSLEGSTDDGAAAAGGATGELAAPWTRAFVAAGGLAHLHSVLMRVNLRELLGAGTGALMKECARLLVTIYARFVVGNAGALRDYTVAGAATPAFAAERGPLTRRILTLLSFATTAGLPREGGSGGGEEEGAAGGAAAPGGADAGAGGAAGVSAAARGMDTVGVEEGLGLHTMFGDEDDEWEAAPTTTTAGKGGKDDAAAKANATEVALVKDVLLLLSAVMVGAPEHVTYAADGSVSVSGTAAGAAGAGAISVHADAATALYSFPGVHAILLLALMAPKDATLRAAVADALRALAMAGGGDGKTTPAAFMLHALLTHVDAAYAFPDTCAEFFGMLAAVLAGTSPLPVDEAGALAALGGMLRAHPIVEVGTEKRDVVDGVLCGLLALLRALVAGRVHLKVAAGPAAGGPPGSSLLEAIFDDVLFSSPEETAARVRSAGGDAGAGAGGDATLSLLGGALPKAKQAVTRKAALDAVAELAVDCEDNAVAVCKLLLPHHDAEAAAALVAAMPGRAPALARATSGSSGGAAKGSRPLGSFADVDDEPRRGGRGTGTGKYTSMSSDGGRSGGTGAAGEGASKGGRMSNRGALLSPPRSSTGYVGLRNLGCICYMNATMQQFFMNPDFRRGVLAWAEPGTTKDEVENSLMFQMQKQFAFLQESDKQYYNPRGLVYSIKDWDGNPTDTMEQKDVPEFLTKLFADMETACQGTPLGTLPKDVFGAVTMQELIADDPRGGERKRLYASRDDGSYFLQLRVKNNKTLEDALAEYVAGETVDYKWELPAEAAPASGSGGAGAGGGGGGGAGAGGGGAADGSASRTSSSASAKGAKPNELTARTTRRVSIKGLADHLMLHLNRFEFNYETEQQEKLNDRFEFPRTLDMWPYTVHGRADAVAEAGTATEAERSEYQYELVGVVIHMGSAVGGHYYSYIRERGGAGPGPRWFEFNDSSVTPWEATDGAFDRDCFGGTEVTAGGSSRFGNAYAYERVKSANAFVLYYDRVRAPAPGSSPAAAAAAAAAVPRPVLAAAPPPPGAAALLARSASASGGDPDVAYLLSALPAAPKTVHAKSLLATYGGGSEGMRAGVRAPLPADLLAALKDDNIEFRRLRTIYDLNYFAFMLDVGKAAIGVLAPAGAGAAGARHEVGYPWAGLPSTAAAMVAGGNAMWAFRLAVSFVVNTLSDSTQTAQLPVWLEGARALMAHNAVPAAWFLQTLLSDPAEFRRMLFADTSLSAETMRTATSVLAAAAVGKVWPLEAAGAPPAAALPAPPSPEAVAAAAGGAKPLVGTPGGLADAFLDLMLAQLPKLHVHWRRFGAYFDTLARIARGSEAARGAMLARGLVGRLGDFALGGGSPHPELNDAGVQDALRLGLPVARDASGRVVPTEPRVMGDAYTSPNLEELLSLLRGLLLACTPPSGAAGSPVALPPQAPLSEVDVSVVTCRAFLQALVANCISWTAARAAAPLVTHLFWGAPVPELAAGERDARTRPDFGARLLMHNAADMLASGIRAAEFNEMRPYFNFAAQLLQGTGEAEGGAERTDLIMNALLAGLRGGQTFFRATELGIEFLVKMVKSGGAVAAWCAANPGAMAWCETWYTTHPRPPLPGDPVMRVTKRPQAYGAYGYASMGNGPMRDASTLYNIRALMAGGEMEFDYLEVDDDPTTVLGKEVELVMSERMRLRGRVTEYDAVRRLHTITLADGSTRTLDMLDQKSVPIVLLHTPEYTARYINADGWAALREEVLAAAAAGGGDASSSEEEEDDPATAGAGGGGGAARGGDAAGGDDGEDDIVRPRQAGHVGATVADTLDGDDDDDGDLSSMDMQTLLRSMPMEMLQQLMASGHLMVINRGASEASGADMSTDAADDHDLADS